jgi:hypothetical protein
MGSWVQIPPATLPFRTSPLTPASEGFVVLKAKVYVDEGEVVLFAIPVQIRPSGRTVRDSSGSGRQSPRDSAFRIEIAPEHWPLFDARRSRGRAQTTGNGRPDTVPGVSRQPRLVQASNNFQRTRHGQEKDNGRRIDRHRLGRQRAHRYVF